MLLLHVVADGREQDVQPQGGHLVGGEGALLGDADGLTVQGDVVDQAGRG